MDYQWDPDKAASNLKKHGIDFADAVGVFEDKYVLTVREDVSSSEQRIVTVGMDFLGRIPTLVYTFRGEHVRMISARPSTRAVRAEHERRRI